jgi:hypothetical protein
MLTYQLQNRFFHIENQKKFEFPNDAEVEICLEPTEQFGVGEKPSKTVVRGSKLHVIYDANTGNQQIFSNPRLEPVETILEWTNLRIEMHGNILHAKWKCETLKNLRDTINELHYIVPILLNLELMEPPVVKYTRGRVGDSTFTWELQEGKGFFDVTSKELQEKRVIDSLLRLEWLGKISNRRLAGALYYFYVARRLTDAGHSPYEFLAEVLLNLCKVLQALFGETRDEVRAELPKVGYSKEEIEEKFIPIMVIRNELDVGHVTVKTFKQEQLTALYNYLSFSEEDFKDLLKRLIIKIEDGSYKLRPCPDVSLTENEQKKMTELIKLFVSRIQKETLKTKHKDET